MTDIINVSPTKNEVQIASKTTLMMTQAADLIVTDTDSAGQAADMAKQLATAIKKLDEERLAITKPFRDGVDAINARFNGLKETLTKASGIVRGKLLEYQQEQEAIAREAREREEAARREAEEAAAREAAEKAAQAPTSQASAPLPEIAPVIITKPVKAAAPVRVRSDGGAVSSIKKTWKPRIADIQALAAKHPELVVADMTAITKLMQGAISKDRSKVDLELPGVEFYQETSLGVR